MLIQPACQLRFHQDNLLQILLLFPPINLVHNPRVSRQCVLLINLVNPVLNPHLVPVIDRQLFQVGNQIQDPALSRVDHPPINQQLNQRDNQLSNQLLVQQDSQPINQPINQQLHQQENQLNNQLLRLQACHLLALQYYHRHVLHQHVHL